MYDPLTCVQREAERVAQKIAELSAARADMDAHIESQKQLLASPELLQDHPELKWDALPRLGVAQKLFAKDRKLADFRYASLCQSGF